MTCPLAGPVSILAHLERWALRFGDPHYAVRSAPTVVFQSSPTSKGGRYHCRSMVHGHASVFTMFQSLAHLERWALRAEPWRSTSHWQSRFNPRPPRKVGATTATRKPRTPSVQVVSILAHLERWALLADKSRINATRAVGNHVSILAHLERWALHVPLTFDGVHTDQGCFNPRPPRKVGATYVLRHGHDSSDHCIVSILAHLERWALRLKRPLHYHVLHGLWFQSSPTSKGGRYGTIRSSVIRHVINVSILAHLERWALQLVRLTSSDGRSLNSVSILAHLERWALRLAPGCPRADPYV